MRILSDKHWVVAAVVEAPPDTVFQHIVAMLQQEVTAFGPEYTESLAIDESNRTITLTGHWWYQGVHTVRPHPIGAQVTYAVHNVARVARTLAFLQHPRYERQMHRQFEHQVQQIGRQLGCAWRLEPAA